MAQVKREKADEWASLYDDSYIEGHRAWLSDFIDRRIVMSIFACDSGSLPAVRKLEQLVDVVK